MADILLLYNVQFTRKLCVGWEKYFLDLVSLYSMYGDGEIYVLSVDISV